MQQTTQLRIIAALLIVVIALAGGLLFFLPSSTASGIVTPPETPPTNEYEKIRNAEISLDPALIFTQTIGGSEDESIVDVFFWENQIYIFGNTSSSDCDFESAGAFVAILGGTGDTRRFVTFSGELVDVTLYDGGFVMALDRDAPTLLAISLAGDEIKSVALPIVSEEEPLDLIFTDNGYLLVSSIEQTIPGHKRLKLTMLSSDLNYIGSLVTDETYSLRYIDTLDVSGKYVLIASAESDLRNMLCYGIWGKKLAHYPLDFSYDVQSFWILDDLYCLASTLSKTVLIKEDGTVITLTDKPEEGSIIGDAECMYVSAGDMFFCVKGDKISYSADYGATSFYADNYIYAVSVSGSKVSVRSFLCGNKTFESSFNYELASPMIFTCDAGLFVVGITKGAIGKADITLLKIQY